MTTFKGLCRQWVKREQALGYKGKKADAACLEFFCGAATVLEATGHPDARAVSAATLLLIATRGAFEARRMAAKPDEAGPVNSCPDCFPNNCK